MKTKGKPVRRLSTHETLCELAKDAIDRVHADTSVPKSRTRDSIRDLWDHCDTVLEALSETGHEEAE